MGERPTFARASVTTALSFAIACVTSGCAPALGGDGYYGCARGGSCPSSAPVCGADGRCHAVGTDAGAADAASTEDAMHADTGSPLSFAACDGTVAGACGADTCYFEAQGGLDHVGYCTRSCTTHDDCPAYQGSTSACVNGRCARGCSGDFDCPESLACASGRWRDDLAVSVCATIDDADPGSYEACTTDASCPRPLSCVGGACLRPCTTSTDCITGLETCTTSGAGPRACLYTCADVTECELLGDMICASHVCRPTPSW